MAIALVLGGGAPNLTLMTGALAAFDECGVKFDIISTSGAGMLVGLLYAAPRNISRREALARSVDMGVHDDIYRWFPVNYKVFHKPGPMAQAYTKFWQKVASSRYEIGALQRELWETTLTAWFPDPWGRPFRMMAKRFMDASTGGTAGDESSQRFIDDMAAFWVSMFCPTDLSSKSLGLCQPAPFVDEVVDFGKLNDYDGEFYLSAYCMDDGQMEMFHKNEINLEHFQAALAFPLIYSPFKLNDKTYIEGAAVDTLNFEGLMKYRDQRKKELGIFAEQTGKRIVAESFEAVRRSMLADPELRSLAHDAVVPSSDRELGTEFERVKDPIRTIVVFDILGSDALISKPRGLYDAWVKSIIIPLTAVAKDDLYRFESKHLKTLGEPPGSVTLVKVCFDHCMPEEHWPNVLDWSYSNLKTLYDVGYKAGMRTFELYEAALTGDGTVEQSTAQAAASLGAHHTGH